MKYKISDTRLYSKKEVIDLLKDYTLQKYYNSYDGNNYEVIIGEDVYKQYPGKSLYYKIKRDYDYRD